MASSGKSRNVSGSHPRAGAGLTRSRRLHLAQEQQSRLLVIGATLAVVAIAVGLVAFGYWYSEVRPRGRTMLAVDGVKVSFAQMQRRMRYELATQPSYAQNPQLLPQATYDDLVRELTIVQRAQSDQGVAIDPKNIDVRMRARLGLGPDADQGTYARLLRAELDRLGINDSDLRRIVEAQAYSDEVQNKFQSEAPENAPQARIELISVADEATARTAIDRINGGEAWATVANELSRDPSVATDGGVKDYRVQGQYPAAYDTFAFTAEPGKISDPLPDASGLYHVVRVIDRPDLPMSVEQKSQYAGRLLNEWIDRMIASVTIVDNWTHDAQAQGDAIEPILRDLVAQQRQQPQGAREPGRRPDPLAA